MITRSGTDRVGLVLTPEINPGFVVQLGPHESQITVKFPGEQPIGGPILPELPPSFNQRASEGPAQELIP